MKVHRTHSNSYTLITPANLSFSVNSDDTEVVIVYKVISGPQYGSLQTLNLVTTPPGGNSAKQHTNTLNQQQSHSSQQQSHSSQQQSGLSQHQSGSNQHQSGSNQQGDNWQSAVEFTDVQVRRSQVRYLHRANISNTLAAGSKKPDVNFNMGNIFICNDIMPCG
ncbi:uncharacterized protein LOC103512368 [Diaphorina citri]|uniref:Uncharacterized protein LOC103512368 n=1 Tax=Diaphorina citri TaxID=121845 RepID=A0A1S3D6C6_DIACI|nr:uncharacterized protein LOC103512368 [Diaphorina citri]